MATPEFVYQDPFPLSKDDTPYRLLSKEHVSLTKFDGKDVLKIEPEALTLLANEAIQDVSFLLRTPHLKKVAAILKDPRGLGQRPLRGVGHVAQRGYLIQGNSSILPGYRYGYSLRQKGPAGLDGCER